MLNEDIEEVARKIEKIRDLALRNERFEPHYGTLFSGEDAPEGEEGLEENLSIFARAEEEEEEEEAEGSFRVDEAGVEEFAS